MSNGKWARFIGQVAWKYFNSQKFSCKSPDLDCEPHRPQDLSRVHDPEELVLRGGLVEQSYLLVDKECVRNPDLLDVLSSYNELLQINLSVKSQPEKVIFSTSANFYRFLFMWYLGSVQNCRKYMSKVKSINFSLRSPMLRMKRVTPTVTGMPP